jgi:predicted GNAT superfamily acetyltransferase
MSVGIRHLEGPEEAALAVVLQREVWGGDEVAAHVLLTAAHNGGLLAGAFVDGSLAGFVWGFLGFDERVNPPRTKHCSHQLGVHPRYRNHGLGFLLKRFQWEYVRSQGIELITWTYDPLLAPNAHLNIARLGAICNTYFRDLYGHLNDDLNAGLPTDRFQVDLWVSSQHVCGAMAEASVAPPAPETWRWLNKPRGDSLPLPLDVSPSADMLALAIPRDFYALKAADPALATAWRAATRAAFESLFAAGCTVTHFVRQPDCGVYLLSPDRVRPERNHHAYRPHHAPPSSYAACRAVRDLVRPRHRARVHPGRD